MARGQPNQFDLPKVANTFDQEAFDQHVQDHGVKMVHWTAMRCPVGLTDPDDFRNHSQDDHGCSNGFLYIKAGTLSCLFTGNGLQVARGDEGLRDSSTVQVTLARTYDNGGEVHMAPFDRLYLEPRGDKPLLVPYWELVQQHQVGVDRLEFPAAQVIDLIDSNNVRYVQDQDFTLTSDGRIKWGQRRPGTGQNLKGRVYSVRYLLAPYYYVLRMLHEVRLAQLDGPDGERRPEQLNQAALIQREVAFHKDLGGERKEKIPASGSFGPL